MKNTDVFFSRFPLKLICCIAFESASIFVVYLNVQCNLYIEDTIGAKKCPLGRDVHFIEIFSKIV